MTFPIINYSFANIKAKEAVLIVCRPAMSKNNENVTTAAYRWYFYWQEFEPSFKKPKVKRKLFFKLS